jgi:hypothetical protein
VTHHDVVVRTDAGWRLWRRDVTAADDAAPRPARRPAARQVPGSGRGHEQSEMMEPRDVLAIHELYARLCQTLGAADWERFDDILTEDVVEDATGVGGERTQGIEAVKDAWRARSRRALSNHVTNIVIGTVDADTCATVAKGFAIYGESEVRTVTHRDTVVKGGDGRWRFAVRVTDGSRGRT